MKKLLTLALAFVAGAIFTAPAVAGPGAPLKGPIKVKECRDPAAFSVTFEILSRGAHVTEGHIKITAVVKNVGNALFESDPRQAIAALYETPAGGRGTVRAQQNIARLAPNETMNLTFDLDWRTSQEFPPTFELLITYDPDIYLDANTMNDDCNQRNNSKQLSGAEINRQWALRDSRKKP